MEKEEVGDTSRFQSAFSILHSPFFIFLLVPWWLSSPPGREAAVMDGFVPSWAADAVWYQVFVSRFCNGEPANDPPGTLPWTGDWAKLESGEAPSLRQQLLGRRYGGDLQGLRSKLPYLHDLGVNTLYLNPIFQAPSEHKYDAADHRHIDDSYGFAGSRLRLLVETADPATWHWSDSDRVFLDFLVEAHRRGFRVVLDAVFNHVGPEFWAWRDVKAAGRTSPYADWFDVTDWGPPLHWQAWDGPDGRLVNFKRFGDGFHAEVEAYLFAVVRRWMDPNGDGDASDGMDGWRLDAAEKVPPGFWRRFRQVVKRTNPQALIVGEIWTEAGDWLGGDQFDVVTNYRFSGPVMRFFSQAGEGYAPSVFVDDLAALRLDHPWDVTLGMLNLLGSHDTERTVTMLTDPLRHRRLLPNRDRQGADRLPDGGLRTPESGMQNVGDVLADGRAEPDPEGEIPTRDMLRPDEDAYRRLKLAALFQFTYPGAPIIYYGDEAGMYGGDDPFCRAPMWRPTAESYRPDVLAFYRQLTRLRGEREELRRGRFRLILADDARRLIAFSRRWGERETIVVVNADAAEHRVVLTMGRPGLAVEVKTLSTEPGGGTDLAARTGTISPDGRLATVCPGLSGHLISSTLAEHQGGDSR
ncbi:MAG: glycoside hydrolase family 13 protein [Planctomycetota bacterium]